MKTLPKWMVALRSFLRTSFTRSYQQQHTLYHHPTYHHISHPFYLHLAVHHIITNHDFPSKLSNFAEALDGTSHPLHQPSHPFHHHHHHQLTFSPMDTPPVVTITSTLFSANRKRVSKSSALIWWRCLYLNHYTFKENSHIGSHAQILIIDVEWEVPQSCQQHASVAISYLASHRFIFRFN